MRVEVKVPQLPESVAERRWSRAQAGGPGRQARRDLIDIETDKVVLELPAPGDGVLVEVLKGTGRRSPRTGDRILDTEAKADAATQVAAAPAPVATRSPQPRRSRQVRVPLRCRRPAR